MHNIQKNKMERAVWLKGVYKKQIAESLVFMKNETTENYLNLQNTSRGQKMIDQKWFSYMYIELDNNL